MLAMEHAQQLIFLDHKKSGRRDGGGRAHPDGLSDFFGKRRGLGWFWAS